MPTPGQETDEIDQMLSEDEDEDDEKAEKTDSADEPDETQDEDEYDEIVYNKETVKVPKSERKTLLQKGYNYDKVHGRLTEQEQKLARLRELTGMDIDAALQNLEQQISSQQVEQYANEYGLPAEDAQREIERDRRLQRLEQETRQVKRLSTLNQEKEPLKTKVYFKELEPEIDRLITDSIGRGVDVSVEAAYHYLRGQKLEELMGQTKSKTEKQTLANIQDRMNRGVSRGLVESESRNADATTDIDRGMAEAFGNDPKKIAAYVKKQIKRS